VTAPGGLGHEVGSEGTLPADSWSVVEIRIREIRLPLREPFRISSGVIVERRICLVEVEDADGNIGWGESVADAEPNYSPETIDTVWLATREWLAPRLLGRQLRGPSEVAPLLGIGVQGHRMARAMVEMACWALGAERAGVPLARLLGGVRERVPTGISIGIQADPDVLAEKALEARDAGYRKVKVKIRPGADLAFVAAVREAIGFDTPLMVDANSAYALDDAEHLAALDDFALTMIEQPLGQDDLVRHASLQRRLQTPICLDESIVSLERAQDMVTLGSGRIVNIKPGRVGGFAESIRIHDFCRSAGIPVWCGGMLESGIGRAHNVALASLPNFSLPGDLSPSARYWTRDIVDPEWTMDEAGMVRVPLDRPGLGVDIDRDAVDRLTVRRAVFRRERPASTT
jgi:o-succinylbenzoate synthase